MKYSMIVVLAGVVIGGATALKFVNGFVASDAPLAGPLSHDFGQIDVGNGNAECVHVFRLKNTAGRSLRITKIASSCGCTSATPSAWDIPVDEFVEIRSTLRLVRPGARHEKVYLRLNDECTVELSLDAMGRHETGFWIVPQVIDLGVNRSEILTAIVTNMESDQPPADLEITAPSVITWDLGAWQLVQRRSVDEQRPARWHARIQVVCNDSTGPLEIQIREGAREARVQINPSVRQTPIP